jgi:hypothetical protein
MENSLTPYIGAENIQGNWIGDVNEGPALPSLKAAQLLQKE